MATLINLCENNTGRTIPSPGTSVGCEFKSVEVSEMSDYEDEFMCDDDEDYDLEYSEDSNSEPDVDLENQYYNSKALKVGRTSSPNPTVMTTRSGLRVFGGGPSSKSGGGMPLVRIRNV